MQSLDDGIRTEFSVLEQQWRPYVSVSTQSGARRTSLVAEQQMTGDGKWFCSAAVLTLTPLHKILQYKPNKSLQQRLRSCDLNIEIISFSAFF